MSSCFVSSLVLKFTDLAQVIEVLRNHGYSGTSYYELGLFLGLSKGTIDTIEANHKGDVNRCLLECISAWLSKKDAVENKGDPTWILLKHALRKLGENAVADGIEREKISVACSILTIHHSKLSQSMHTPLDIARTLHREGILSQVSLNTVESTRGTVQKMEVLLSLVYEAVSINHKCMETFVSVLHMHSQTVPVANDILKEYMKHYADFDKLVVMSDDDDDTSSVSSLDDKNAVLIPRSWRGEFDQMRTSFGTMFNRIRKAITKLFTHTADDLRDYLEDSFPHLSQRLENVQQVRDILKIVREQCTLTNICILEGIVQEFEVTEAEEHIKKYKDAIIIFRDKVKTRFCFGETFEVVYGPTPLQCETVTFVLNWNANQYTIADVEDIIGEGLGKDSNVKIKVIVETNSIKVICTVPVCFTIGKLIARASEKMELLRKRGLLLLTIGYYTLYDHTVIDEKVMSLEKRLKIAEEERDAAIEALQITEKEVATEGSVIKERGLGRTLRTMNDELNQPRRIAISDDSCYMIVTECLSHHVNILDKEGKIMRTFGGKEGNGNLSFNFPRGVTITPDNFILVTDGDGRQSTAKIQKISMDGRCIASINGKSSRFLQFDFPDGIEISPITGHIYFADTRNHRIQVLTPNLTFSHSIGKYGSAKGQFKDPRDLAIDGKGFLYVADWSNHRIQVFTPEGQFVNQFGSAILSTPVGITVDRSTNLVYVTEFQKHCISVFTSEGQYINSFGKGGQLKYPMGIILDKKSLYVCDHRALSILPF